MRRFWIPLLLLPLSAAAAGPLQAGTLPMGALPAFSDLRPDDWAYQALADLSARYGCIAGYPNGTYNGGQAMTRYEAAALLNACLDRITEVTDELKRLLEEFATELAVVRSREDDLAARVGELEARRFSTTTKLSGLATLVIGANSFSGSHAALVQQARTAEGATTFNYDLRLTLDTSFSGKDLLRTQLRSGNFADSGFGNANGLNQLEVAFQESCGTGSDCGDVLAIYRLYYQFPIGANLTATLGARVRQDDMLALWPSVYPADTILDVFSYTGAPGAYDTNLGAGAGLWWKQNGWSVSGQYIAYNGDQTLGTLQSGETGTIQLGYAAPSGSWGAAAVGTVSHGFPGGIYPGSGTPLAALNTTVAPALAAFGSDGLNQSVGLAGFWQPGSAGWVPSISAGWGLNRVNPGVGVRGFDPLTSQSWMVGLQWNDAFRKGNTAGMAFGQPTFLTACGNSCAQLLGRDQAHPHDGLFAWEWWYRFQVTDAISVTPALFYLSNPFGQINTLLAAGSSSHSPSFNNLGVLVKTSLRF